VISRSQLSVLLCALLFAGPLIAQDRPADGQRAPPRDVTGWPGIVNLRADPFEKAMFEADMGYLRWYADNMWIFVPIQEVLKQFLVTIPDYPFQQGSSLNAAGINYGSLKAADAMERLQQLETIGRPNN
jgi:arylsulfatase